VNPVTRSELLDLGAYEQIRERFRARIIRMKQLRRIALGTNMTLLFENHDTVLFQIQEMLRTERITAEKAILHELETYNELIPGPHELSATIFIEYPHKEERDRMLATLAGVDDKFYLLAAGEQLGVIPDNRGTETDRTMAVHYVKFPLSPAAERAIVERQRPIYVGVEHPEYTARAEFTQEFLDTLREDLV
jgi:hypothetical protein